MQSNNAFEAVQYGKLQDFKQSYDGNINSTYIYNGYNYLSMTVLYCKDPKEKIRIIKFLLSEGIDINNIDPIYQRNALQTLYFFASSPPLDYLMEVTKMFVEHKIDLNWKDRFGSTALNYALLLREYCHKELKVLYLYLLENGSKYDLKDNSGYSCLDYAKMHENLVFLELAKRY